MEENFMLGIFIIIIRFEDLDYVFNYKKILYVK